MADSNNSPVNLSYLHEYLDGDMEAIHELLQDFMASFVSDLEELEACASDGENKQWTEVAHKLKGSAAFIGAEDLRSLCAKAQGMLVAGSDERKSLHASIKERYLAICAYLKEEKIL